MSPVQPIPPRLQLTNTPDYRDSYANSVQMRVNLWDFFLLFGTVGHQSGPDSVTIHNFQGVYLSPPQAKALANLLQQNLKQYEAAFGEIHMESQGPAGVVQ
jgi:flagellar protein FlaG